jgi:CheY-like chemotaxis protein
VNVAYDGREGFAAILKTMPDLVLSDISMPVMSGFELLERLTALAPRFGNMPFVFLTALTDRDNELKGRQLGRRRLRDQADRFRRAGRQSSMRGSPAWPVSTCGRSWSNSTIAKSKR